MTATSDHRSRSIARRLDELLSDDEFAALHSRVERLSAERAQNEAAASRIRI